MTYDQLASLKAVQETINALKGRNIEALLVNTKEEALEKVKEMIPAGASVMTGSSATLNEIGFSDFLISKNHSWRNLKDEIVAEADPDKQNKLRKQSVLAGYFLGSVHAVAKDGKVLVASASGSQIPSYAFTSPNVIWVVGTQKIVGDLNEAFDRVKTYVFPLEDQRMKNVGAQGSVIARWLIFEREIVPSRKVTLIFINEKLGF